MTKREFYIAETIPRIVKVIFFICAFYFFLMGVSLIFIPEYLTKGLSDSNLSPTLIGMLRGAGGSIIPYSLLYILLALDPFKRMWAMYVILVANLSAIILDIVSVSIGEYNILNAMIDFPIELTSVIGIIIVFWTNSKLNNVTNP